jgi:hypothetical protein
MIDSPLEDETGRLYFRLSMTSAGLDGAMSLNCSPAFMRAETCAAGS